MKFLRWFNLLLIVALAFAFLPQHTASAAPAAVEIDRNSLYVPGEVVVAFTDGLTASAYGAQANALAGQVGATVVARYYNYALLSFPVDADVPAMVEKVAATGRTLVAQPNYVSWVPEYDSQMGGISRYEIDGSYVISSKEGNEIVLSKSQLAAMRRIVKTATGKTTAIPTFPSEFTYEDEALNTNGWDLINAEVIYRDTTATSAVCVIDTGVDYKHPDLYGKVVNGFDFVNNDTLPNDDNGHGTHVAGIITAKGNNGATTAIGVNLGKVVAVKVLTAYGWGTSFTISAGIRYCAGRTDVKVINLSLGSSHPDSFQYDALRYAIVTKGKLVVAAAGNDSTSALHFPSSWAKINVNVAGNREATPADPPIVGVTNEISQGLISVAAANVNPMPLPNWIDIDNSETREDSEDFGTMDCATTLTNYGDTVSIVAPGLWVYSTTPVSYAFFHNQYSLPEDSEPWAPGYDYQSGTSMASPFVAAAAARVWGVNKTANNAAIKTILIDTGRDLDYSYDPYDLGNETFAFDPELGFKQESGEFGWFIDEFNDPPDSYIKAPFCWPWDTDDPLNPFGPNEDMSLVTYLDIAAAMERYMAAVSAYDATSSMPLEGALIRVQQYNPILKVTQTKDTSKVSRFTPLVLMTNLPEPGLYEWAFGVQKTGYTSSYQIFSRFQLGRDEEGIFGNPTGRTYMPVDGIVSVPPAKDIQVVADWLNPDTDLDLHVWLPDASPAAGYIGAVNESGEPRLLDYVPTYDGGTPWGVGTLLTPIQVGMPTDTIMPYAQLIVDGGSYEQTNGYSTFESITIKMKPGYSIPYYAGDYQVFLTDYSKNYSGSLHDQDNTLNYDGNFAYPTVRIWYKGVIKNNNQQLYKAITETCSDFFGTGWPTYDFWHVANINGAAVPTNKDICGPSSILP